MPVLRRRRAHWLPRAAGIVCAVLLIAETALAATIRTSLTPARARVGDLLQLKLTVEGAKKTAKIEWPSFHPDSLSFQLISTDSAGLLPKERIFHLALYDTGKYFLPPLPVILHTANSRETLFTRHVPVEIVSALSDTASAPRPIKGPRALPWTLREILAQALWPAMVLLLAVAAFLLYRRYGRKGQVARVEIPEITLLAHELAMRELIELRDKKLPQKGMLKEFFSELSEILRRYVERRYGFPALEMTTWDIGREVNRDDYPQIVREECLFILRQSDLVKFAKFIPPWESCEEHLRRTFRIVEVTKESLEPETMEKAA
ncbi:MAG: hypothetical protein V1784_09130 [bacterium]